MYFNGSLEPFSEGGRGELALVPAAFGSERAFRSYRDEQKVSL